MVRQAFRAVDPPVKPRPRTAGSAGLHGISHSDGSGRDDLRRRGPGCCRAGRGASCRWPGPGPGPAGPARASCSASWASAPRSGPCRPRPSAQPSSAKPVAGHLEEGGGAEAAHVPLAVGVQRGGGGQAGGGEPVHVGQVEPGARRARASRTAGVSSSDIPEYISIGSTPSAGGASRRTSRSSQADSAACTPGSAAACSVPSGQRDARRRRPRRRAEASSSGGVALGRQHLAGGRVDHRQHAVARRRRPGRRSSRSTCSPCIDFTG